MLAGVGVGRWTFLHDGAHWAKKTKAWLEEQKVKSLGWPANSPDLNIMRNHLGMVRQRREPKSGDEIWQVARETWDQIPLEVVQRQITDWGRRLSAVTESQGAHPNIKRWWMI